MATSTRASKNDHMTTLEFVFSLIARWIRSLTDMYSCSCLTPKKRIICENVRQIIYQVEVDDPDFWRCRIAYFAGKVIDVFYVKLHYFHKKQEWYFIDANLVLKIAQVSWKQSTLLVQYDFLRDVSQYFFTKISWKQLFYVCTTKDVTKELNWQNIFSVEAIFSFFIVLWIQIHESLKLEKFPWK